MAGSPDAKGPQGPGAGPNILAQRLRELERVGVVRRRTLAPPAGSRVYELTEWGAELAPIVAALGRWGSRSPIVAPQGDVGPDSLMLTLRSCFDPQAAGSWTANYEVRLGRNCFTVRVVDGQLVDVTRGQPHDQADATIETDPNGLRALFSKQQSVTAALGARQLTVTGDADAVQRLLDAIRM